MGRMKELFMARVNSIMEDSIVEVKSLAEMHALATEVYQLFGENCMYRELEVGYDISLLDEKHINDLTGEWRKCDV